MCVIVIYKNTTSSKKEQTSSTNQQRRQIKNIPSKGGKSDSGTVCDSHQLWKMMKKMS